MTFFLGNAEKLKFVLFFRTPFFKKTFQIKNDLMKLFLLLFILHRTFIAFSQINKT